MSKKQRNISSSKRQLPLETANEMFKAAFQIKKNKIAEQNSQLSESEIEKKTAEYFRTISGKSKQ